MTSEAKLAYSCKTCGKTFSEGRSLGGHFRQAHPAARTNAIHEAGQDPGKMDSESATRVLLMWKGGADPFDVVTSLKLHPRFVREVLKEFDELLTEWRRFREA